MIHNVTLNSPILSGFADIGRLLGHSAKSTHNFFSRSTVERKRRIPQGNERTITIRSDIVQAGPVRVSAKDRRLP